MGSCYSKSFVPTPSRETELSARKSIHLIPESTQLSTKVQKSDTFIRNSPLENNIMTIRDVIIEDDGILNNVLIVGTLYVGLDETAGKDIQIVDFLTFFMNEKIDIVCLQGFHKFSVIRDFIKKLEGIASTNSNFAHVKLYYAPRVSNIRVDHNSFDVTWSSSGDYEDSTIDCVIISTHPILHHGKVKFEDHLDLANSSKYIVLANINYRGTLVSVYSASLQEDLVGIKNTNLRRKQVEQLDRVIHNNRTEMLSHCLVDGVQNQGIHLICGNLNINEIENDMISREYINVFRNLKLVDIYRYVLKCKNITADCISDATNISGFRTSYIAASIENVDPVKDDVTVEFITNHLLDNFGILVVNSKIKQLQGFDNYVVEGSFKIKTLDVPKNVSEKSDIVKMSQIETTEEI